MNSMKLMLIILAAAVLIAASCGNDSTGPNPPPEDDWLPLTVGNWWNYIIDGYMIPGSSADTLDIEGTTERRVTALLNHSGGFPVYEFRSILNMSLIAPDTTFVDLDTSYVYIRVTDDEIQAYDDTVSTDYMLLAPLPLALSQTWKPWDDSTTVREVVSLTASVTVAAGSFSNCAIIRETDQTEPDEQWDQYLHSGTGIISDRVTNGDDLELNFNLETYSVQ